MTNRCVAVGEGVEQFYYYKHSRHHTNQSYDDYWQRWAPGCSRCPKPLSFNRTLSRSLNTLSHTINSRTPTLATYASTSTHPHPEIISIEYQSNFIFINLRG